MAETGKGGSKGRGAKSRQGATSEAATVAIYALHDPTTDEIRYIGKANNPAKRLKSHIRDSRRRHTPVYCWINKLVASQTVPRMSVLEWATTETWCESERRAIALYGATGRLLNLAAGGDEPYCSQETRAKNGRMVADSIHNNPKARRLWELKKGIADCLQYFRNRGLKDPYNKHVARLKDAAVKRPDLFGQWLSLEEMA